MVRDSLEEIALFRIENDAHRYAVHILAQFVDDAIYFADVMFGPSMTLLESFRLHSIFLSLSLENS